MFCRKCGTEIRLNAKFCHKCGAPVPTPKSTPAPEAFREGNPATAGKAAASGKAAEKPVATPMEKPVEKPVNKPSAEPVKLISTMPPPRKGDASGEGEKWFSAPGDL